ncbi:MAG: hypothetical protein J5501_09800 [Ruminococcus sp.]|nr:hypothetical protein [Ruminococcus sp.]
MELIIFIKNNKYIVQDKSQKTIYTVKKKSLGSSKLGLYDHNNYRLYSLVQTGEDRKPTFTITHNDSSFIHVSCKSLFLDPTLVFKKGKEATYELASKDRMNFTLMKDGNECGKLETNVSVSGELQYSFKIDYKVFDDYFVLFAVAVDKVFGGMNREKLLSK